MRRTIPLCALAALAVLGLVAVGCGNDKPGEPTGGVLEAKPTSAPADTSVLKAAPPVTAPATVSAQPPPATASASASAAAAPSSSATAAAAASGSAGALSGPKTFDCGAKGQKPCPMQGWMKGVMAGASSSGDGAKLSSALSYVAARPPPGFGTWASIANAGAAKAKAGDIDGAKATCKQCHDAYKEKYKTTMRDRPF